MLEHFDLTIPAGSSLAIVGQNGAGKTTIAKLLCRLYDPQSGAIEIDGVDMREFDLASWRSRVAAVFQDFIRLELPLRDNVAPAGAPDDVVRAALESAGAANLAGLDTVLARGYDGGTDLSGGQWQRIALARALAAVKLGAGVVLLDEPTAQLDVRGEAEIFERLLAATRHCTTILISHRFSTVRHADRICVLEHGRVIELGTHDELMALGGRYRTMFDLQAQRFNVPGGGGHERMTSSPDRDHAIEPAASGAVVHVAVVQAGVPPRAALDGRGVRAVAAGGAARCAARVVADAARQRRARAQTRHGARRGDRPGRVGRRDVVSAHGQHARAAPLPRQGDDRARIACRATAGLDRDHRASGTPGVSRSAVHAAQPGVRARPHVHVAVFHARVDPAAGRDHGAAGVDSPGAAPAGGVRGPDGA